MIERWKDGKRWKVIQNPVSNIMNKFSSSSPYLDELFKLKSTRKKMNLCKYYKKESPQ